MSESPPWDTSAQQGSGQYQAQAPYHIRKGIWVTAGHLGLLQPALAQPSRPTDATVARIIGVHPDQADDLMLAQDQTGRWDVVPGLTPALCAAVREYEAAISGLRLLRAGVLAAAWQLKAVTIDDLLATSGLRFRGAA
jgi:hypothetical protein